MTVEERIKQQRDQRLIDLGYVTWEYEPEKLPEGENQLSAQEIEKEYPNFDMQCNRRYRVVPVEVTDEEFQQILAIGGEPDGKSSNTLATILTWIGWLGFVAFLLLGMVNASNAYNNEFLAFFTPAAIGTACLLGCLWFAEVLKLLHSINRKL